MWYRVSSAAVYPGFRITQCWYKDIWLLMDSLNENEFSTSSEPYYVFYFMHPSIYFTPTLPIMQLNLVHRL